VLELVAESKRSRCRRLIGCQELLKEELVKLQWLEGVLNIKRIDDQRRWCRMTEGSVRMS